MRKNILFIVLCALGSGFAGFFSNYLSEIYGVVLFGLGIGLIVYSIFNIVKND